MKSILQHAGYIVGIIVAIFSGVRWGIEQERELAARRSREICTELVDGVIARELARAGTEHQRIREESHGADVQIRREIDALERTLRETILRVRAEIVARLKVVEADE
jgi:hypothetical protein